MGTPKQVTCLLLLLFGDEHGPRGCLTAALARGVDSRHSIAAACFFLAPFLLLAIGCSSLHMYGCCLHDLLINSRPRISDPSAPSSRSRVCLMVLAFPSHLPLRTH